MCGGGTGRRAFKLHAHFGLLKGVPASMGLTDAAASEWRHLAASLLPGRTYVMDRGYACFELFGLIQPAGGSLVCRARDNSVYRMLEDRPVTPAAAAAGVASDRLVMLWCDSAEHRPAAAGRAGRQATPQAAPRPRRAGAVRPGLGCHRPAQPAGRGGRSAAAVPVALRLRSGWSGSSRRFFKHVLGCRHLLAHNPNGIKIQTYTAIVCCLLIALYTGGKPTLRTYEMLCHYLGGPATADELAAHVAGPTNQPG